MSEINYTTPGVYIEEVPSGDRPIQAVGTSTAGFVGRAPNSKVAINKAVAVNSWAEFMRRFMSPDLLEDKTLLDAAEAARAALDKAKKDKNSLSVNAIASERKEKQGQVDTAQTQLEEATKKLQYPSTHLSDAVYGFFLNGGMRCWIVNVGPTVNKIEKVETPEVDSEGNPVLGMDGKPVIRIDYKPVYDKDNKPVQVEPPISAFGATPLVGLDILEKVDEVAIVAAPGYTDLASYDAIRNHCDMLRDRVGILDGPETLDDGAMNLLSGNEDADANWSMPFQSKYGQLSLYVPWIEVANPAVNGNNGNHGNNGSKPHTKLVPPSGHIAGIWARSDFTRGVHKAPANEPVRGAIGLNKQITQVEQGQLNINGVNVIRYFPNVGFLVWGARTFTSDASYKYLNVRRLFNMIEESIAESTRWIVFEPNDRPLWQAIRRDVTAFLMGFWRSGALMGRTPEDAFFVKCDDENNPIDSIKAGRVVIEVGLAPVYPAEFVIFRISQYQAKTEVEVQPV